MCASRLNVGILCGSTPFFTRATSRRVTVHPLAPSKHTCVPNKHPCAHTATATLCATTLTTCHTYHVVGVVLEGGLQVFALCRAVSAHTLWRRLHGVSMLGTGDGGDWVRRCRAAVVAYLACDMGTSSNTSTCMT